MRQAVIREGPELDAGRAAPRHVLEKGEEIVVVAKKWLTSEVVRLRFEGGWVSETSKGRPILCPVVYETRRWAPVFHDAALARHATVLQVRCSPHHCHHCCEMITPSHAAILQPAERIRCLERRGSEGGEVR